VRSPRYSIFPSPLSPIMICAFALPKRKEHRAGKDKERKREKKTNTSLARCSVRVDYLLGAECMYQVADGGVTEKKSR